MKIEAMDENLIGYLLDALEEPDRRQVEAHLRNHPECRARLETLRRALAPLAVDSEAPAPPAGLPIRTLARIAEERARPLPKAPPPSRRAASSWRGPRRADLLAAAVLVLLLGGLAGPWIVQQWHLYGRQACAANLHTYGDALLQYGNRNNTQLPMVAEAGPRNYAASFVPMLRQAGYLVNPQHLACDAAGQRSDPPPTVEEVENARDQADMNLFRQRAQRLAGNYAYSLGYRENGILHGLSTQDSNHPILADHHPAHVAGSNSPNHGGRGQNILYVDGHVKWCESPVVGCEGHDIYHNCKGKIAAGLGRDDAPLGAGEAGP